MKREPRPVILIFRRAPLFLKTWLAAGISLTILMACSSESSTPAPTSRVTTEKSTGILQTSMGTYEFTPINCAIHRENGVDDIEIRGPGTAPDGERIHFDLSSTANEVAVGLGVDSPFSSPKRQLKAGKYSSQEFAIVLSGSAIIISKLVLVDGQGQSIDSNASLRIDCAG
jgi:hypothetical protein